MAFILRKKSAYKLVPELVPTILWGRTASRMLKGKKAWKEIRQNTLKVSSDSCSFCSSRGKVLFCHEIWQYRKTRGIVRLNGFRMACERCNTVLHAGRSMLLGFEEDVVSYLREKNEIGSIEAVLIILRAFEEWTELEEVSSWKMQIPQNLIKQYPVLADLPSYEPPDVEVDLRH